MAERCRRSLKRRSWALADRKPEVHCSFWMRRTIVFISYARLDQSVCKPRGSDGTLASLAVWSHAPQTRVRADNKHDAVVVTDLTCDGFRPIPPH